MINLLSASIAVHVQTSPATFGHLFFGDILLLRINERPNFIALDAAHFQVADSPIVVFSASAAHLFQESQDCDFGSACHSHDGIDGNTFNKSRDYLGALWMCSADS